MPIPDLLAALQRSVDAARAERAAVAGEHVRHSFCEACGDSITIRLAEGQRWPDASWKHDGGPAEDADHPPVPELRIAIDATCPACEYPEIGFAPSRGEFVCSRCQHTQTERPKD